MATPTNHVTNFTVRVGGAIINGSLVPVVKQGKKNPAKTRLGTPDGSQVTQVWIDSQNQVYRKKDLVYVSLTTGEVIKKEEYEEAHQPEEMPKNFLNFSIHHPEVLDYTVPSDTKTYALKPADDTYTSKAYDALYGALSRGDMILLAYGIVRDSEGLFMLSPWDSKLVIRKMESPENMNPDPFSRNSVATAADVAAMRTQMLGQVEEFDPGRYRDQHLQRLTDLAGGAKLAPKEVSVFAESLNELFG